MAKSQGRMEIEPSPLDVSITNGKIIVCLPRSGIGFNAAGMTGQATLPPSSSGKTLLVATTGGFQKSSAVIDGREVRVNLTAFVYPDKGEATDTELKTGKFEMDIPEVGAPVVVELSKETLVLIADCKSMPDPLKEGGKMQRVAGGGDKIVAEQVVVNGQPLRINFYAGVYPPKAEKK